MTLKPVAVTPRVSATIDFLRWGSALLVLLFHVRLNVVPDDALRYAAAGVLGEMALALTGAGHAAVMCFFVLSGYLVGGTVVNKVLTGRFDLGSYAADRATRIYVVLVPALALGLAFDAARIAYVGAAPFDAPGAYSPATIVGNLVFLQDVLVPPVGSNLPLWSLAYEGWYYVLFPLLFMAARATRPRGSRAMFGAVGIALLLVLAALHLKLVVMFAAWLMGVAVRYLPRPIVRLPTVAWTIALAAVFSHHLFRDYLPVDYLIPAAATANLLLTVTHAPPGHVTAGARRHARLADFSFSLYLSHSFAMHLILAVVTGRATLALGLAPGWAAAGAVLLLSATLIAFAWLFAQATESRTKAVRAWLDTVYRRRSQPARQGIQ